MRHHCHALDCVRPCPPSYLMCPPHWRKTPAALRGPVWAAYREGQCDDKEPSWEWCAAADAAVAAVARLEGLSPAKVLYGTESHGFRVSFHRERYLKLSGAPGAGTPGQEAPHAPRADAARGDEGAHHCCACVGDVVSDPSHGPPHVGDCCGCPRGGA